ncbi:polysaccharide deacetylase family protein [Jiella sp. MQZ9-1]|uniref:Polysaccharide deacetylase family protein n=1 Tax=Jiella flava TaxID=2816857 RepID=A0A939JT76_9HYPH|nr:polysaccharide deacetylase family protein [Jiella flava]MBO0663693.1 polysaccharide deacetylase family protein [Jiella flava]MCD2472266.1 polysaccharide deacetylase family protein [Jiella flava]
MQAFDALDEELDRWTASGRTVALWWRDDDAAGASAQLTRLIGAARRHRLPLAIAAVPATMQPDLVGALAVPGITVLQHGFAHRNHAGAGMRAVECGGDRATKAVLDELGEGMRILMRTFGASFLPFMVPPWNRIDPLVAAALPQQGYFGLSGFGPRLYQGAGGGGATDGQPLALPPRLAAINAHLDLLTWKGGARFAGIEKLITLFAERLADRRLRRTDPDEPFGLLTHHLDHDEATWSFLERLLGRLGAHPAIRFQPITTLLAETPMG